MKRDCLADLYPILRDSDADAHAIESIAWKHGVQKETMLSWIRKENDPVDYVRNLVPRSIRNQKCKKYLKKKENVEQCSDPVDLLIETKCWNEWNGCVNALPFKYCIAHYRENII